MRIKEYLMPAGLILVIFGMLALLVNLKIESDKRWAEFMRNHDCKVVEKREGEVAVSTGIVINANGTATPVVLNNSTPDSIGYLCNDGITYWR